MAALDASEEDHLERLLRVGTCLAMCGYGAQVGALAACARAFRADAQLWTAYARHKGLRGRTALMHAALIDDVHRIQFLVERGAEVEAVDAVFGETALMLACDAGAHQDSGAINYVRCLHFCAALRQKLYSWQVAQ